MNNWSSLKKIIFRFFFSFFILYTSLWNMIPFLNEWTSKFYYYPSFFVQNYILKLWDTPRWEHTPTGSGDTLDDYILLLAYFILAVIISIIWTILDRDRPNYEKLDKVLTIGLRFYLANIMFTYGIEKIFMLQMPYPLLTQFHMPLGLFTPMRFTWTHLGYGYQYQFIGGLLETIGGLLILFRRTTLLGGLILLVVIIQVVMLNYFYGVPVKIFSSFLLLVTIYIIKDHLWTLFKFLLGEVNQKIDLGSVELKEKWQKCGRIIIKTLFIAYTFGFTFYSYVNFSKEFKNYKKVPMYGAYQVIDFNKNNMDTLSYLDKWNFVVFGEGYADNQSISLIRSGYSDYAKVLATTSSTDSVSIKFQGTPNKIFKGRYLQSNDTLKLFGRMENDSISVKLKKDTSTLVLPNRKFKWIMEDGEY